MPLARVTSFTMLNLSIRTQHLGPPGLARTCLTFFGLCRHVGPCFLLRVNACPVIGKVQQLPQGSHVKRQSICRVNAVVTPLITVTI